MNQKISVVGAVALLVAAVAVCIFVGVRTFRPPVLAPPRQISVRDLLIMQEQRPNELTQDQKELLARIPDRLKQKYLKAGSFFPPSPGAKTQPEAH